MRQKSYRAKLGPAFALIYLVLTVFVIIDYRQCVGSRINLCGLSLILVTAPSQMVAGDSLN